MHTHTQKKEFDDFARDFAGISQSKCELYST